MSMTSSYYSKLTDYFRRSVIDTERLAPDLDTLFQAVKPVKDVIVTKDMPFAVNAVVWEKGELTRKTTVEIFKLLRVDEKINIVNIRLMPRVDLQNIANTQFLGQQSPILVPIVAEVLLARNGVLKPGALPPYVPREFLAPTDSEQIPFGNVDTLDRFLTLNPYNVDTWEELQEYTAKLLSSLVADDVTGGSCDTPLGEIEISPDYVLKKEISLILLETSIRAGRHIVNVYDAILKACALNALYQNLLSTQCADKEEYQELTFSEQDCLSHVGQMTGEFSLSDNQRNALHHTITLQDGGLLAVNGPPGTGKTTLLRSIVADAWVKAALKQEEPPIIFAASSSNQAVTNILDSFFRVKEEGIEEGLQGRWLPGLTTYGLYACGENKANADNAYPFMTKKGDGLMQLMEQDRPLPEMVEYFCVCFYQWYGEKITELPKIKQVLHTALERNVKSQNDLQSSFKELEKMLAICIEQYGSEEALAQHIIHCEKQVEQLDRMFKHLGAVMDEFLQQWQKRSFWWEIFYFLPPVKKKMQLNNEILARKLQLKLSSYADEDIKVSIELQQKKVTEECVVVKISLDEAKKIKGCILAFRTYIADLVGTTNIGVEFGTLDFTKLVAKLDVSLRFCAFKLATHYWELRWLQDMAFQSGAKVNSPKQRLQLYQRYAKLTPCFVSTFNMLPYFLTISEREAEGWKTTPLTDAIDLLIVDEAGQALPHVAAASFLLAKKAVLVGDIYQIAPVWSLSKGIDRANLQATDLLLGEMDDEFWLKAAMLASSGNLMKIAHRQTSQTQFSDLEPGLYLTEHRRCYDSIIQYCNRLIYKGHLLPKRGDSVVKSNFPMMGFYHHKSASQSLGRSRINDTEAKLIVQWISGNLALLTQTTEIEKSVAVITPFNRQSKLIRQCLNKKGLSKVRVGTVHTFQGAECETVLFSSVYASNDALGVKYYDTTPNMLNVAVSRAKNSFIVFGDYDVFGLESTSSPSSLLRQYLTRVNSPQSVRCDTAELSEWIE